MVNSYYFHKRTIYKQGTHGIKDISAGQILKKWKPVFYLQLGAVWFTLSRNIKRVSNVGVNTIPTRFVKLHYGTLKEESGVQ